MERPSRTYYQIVVHVKDIGLERYSRLIVVKHSRTAGPVKRALTEICVVIWIVEHHYAGGFLLVPYLRRGDMPNPASIATWPKSPCSAFL